MTDAPSFNEDFTDLLKALNDEGVEFVVVGAHALAAHGVVRASGDLDVFVRPSSKNAQRVVRALHKFGAPLDRHSVSIDDFQRAGTVYQIGLPPRRIDLLTEISGLSFDEAVEGGVRVDVAEVSFFVPSAKSLLINKRATGRDKDLEDTRRLEEVLRRRRDGG